MCILFFLPTSTKPQADILELNKVNGCYDISFGDHSILQGEHIPPLKSHGQALEEELCFPGVLSDNCDAPANLLRYFYGCLMPCTCCLNGKRTEDVGAGQTGILLLLLFRWCEHWQTITAEHTAKPWKNGTTKRHLEEKCGERDADAEAQNSQMQRIDL